MLFLLFQAAPEALRLRIPDGDRLQLTPLEQVHHGKRFETKKNTNIRSAATAKHFPMSSPALFSVLTVPHPVSSLLHPSSPSLFIQPPLSPCSHFHTLIVETYRKINFQSPVERPNVSPLCLIDDAQTPSHTPLLFIAPQSWSPFSAVLWQIITGDVMAIPSSE